MRKFFLSTSLILTFGSTTCSFSVAQSANFSHVCKIKKILAVGDSLSDTGALVGVAQAVMQDWAPKINTDKLFAKPLENHSFTNGPTAIQVVANQLQLPFTPGWKVKIGQKEYEKKGNNYAFAGAQASKANFHKITKQKGKKLKFKEFSKKFKKLCKQKFLDCNDINNQVDALLAHHQLTQDDLIFFAIGSNDLMFQAINFSQQQQEKVIINSIKNQEKALRKLIANGAKRILMMNTPNLSKILRNIKKFPEKLEEISALCINYNQGWLKMAKSVQKEYPEYIEIVNIDRIFLNLLDQFKKDGFNVDQPAFTYKIKLNNSKDKPAIITVYDSKEDTTKYFYFDETHPTEIVHKLIGYILLEKSQEKWLKN